MPPPNTAEAVTLKPVTPPSDIAAAIDAGERIGAVIGKKIDLPRHNPIILIRTGDKYHVESMKDHRKPFPDFLQRRVQFDSVDSFTAYLNEFKDAKDTCQRVYAEMPNVDADVNAEKPEGAPSDLPDFVVTAIIDDHKPGCAPSWCDHVAILRLRRSRAWADWLGMNRRPMTQRQFAEFIEDHLAQIVTPDAAKMLEIASSINVSKSANFRSATRLDNGQVQLQYVETIKDEAHDGSCKIPQEIELKMPVFDFTSDVALKARIRYRIDGGAIALAFILNDPERIERKCFTDDVCETINRETQATVLFGRVLP